MRRGLFQPGAWATRAGRIWLGVAVMLFSGLCLAHERFIPHALKVPLNKQFFLNNAILPAAQRDPDRFLGVNNNIWLIGLNGAVVTGAFLVAWFLRFRLEEAAKRYVFFFARGGLQRFVHNVACFITDRPVRNQVFHTLGEWAVLVFMRAPGLVLMYSAANNSLVMPSFPLDPSVAVYFKFAQVGLALLILTQTLLPLCGALIIGTWLYLNRWGVMVAMDAVPVLTAAVVYITSPWTSHKLAITGFNKTQMRWARLTLGFGFMLLGFFKIYNHNLTAGVPDNFPAVMNDPMLKLFAFDSDMHNVLLNASPLTSLKRECWIISFAMAEIMFGFLMTTGTFTRLWCLINTIVFTKLMLLDFGWEEIPHIYPIGAFLAVMFSNKLTSEFDPLEAITERLYRQKKWLKQALLIGVPSLALAFLLIFPALYIISFFDRSKL